MPSWPTRTRLTDGDGYTIEQEFEDVASVVDAIASGPASVALWGHSYGAGCAMGAAALTDNVSRVILYEPGLGIAYPPGWLEAHEDALAAGDAERVIRAVASIITQFVGIGGARS